MVKLSYIQSLLTSWLSRNESEIPGQRFHLENLAYHIVKNCKNEDCYPSVWMNSLFIFTFWTNNPKLARHADLAGVDRVGVDLEVLGKAERQQGLKTWVSQHQQADIPAVREVLSRAQLFARTNPIHPNIKSEIEQLLELGVQVLMLPFFTSPEEVAEFVGLVAGRAKVVPLVEHIQAAESIEEIVKIEGVDELHIGLNDLGLSMGVRNRFAMLTSPVVEQVAAYIREAGIPFGFGGIGRAQDNSLLIPADLIYAQYPRLGGTATLISQAFRGAELSQSEFVAEIAKARSRLNYWFSRSAEEIAAAHEALCEIVEQLRQKQV